MLYQARDPSPRRLRVTRGAALRLRHVALQNTIGLSRMAKAKMEFTEVSSLRAEALGDPGQRTFRIVVGSSSESAVIWLEKGQLFQLALAINQMTAALPITSEEDQPQDAEPLTGPSLEFNVEKLALGHDGKAGKFIIDAYDSDSEDDTPTARIWGDKAQFGAFSEEALRICAAGRPLCPLCGGPMDPTGHKCARTNGHALQDVKEL